MNLFWGNFEFEHHLGPGGPRALSAQIRRRNAELAYCLASLGQPGDCLWTPEPPDVEFAAHLADVGVPGVRFVGKVEDVPPGAMLVPWGWCRAAGDWAAKNGWTREAPDLAVVALVNSRGFSSALESEWDVGLSGAVAIRTLPELERVLTAAAERPGGWVIKANFGMSARERILGRGGQPRAQDLEWARRRLERGESIFFEPWVEAIAEFGCQFSLPPTGRPRLEGVTGLLTDAQGTYRGSRLFPAGGGTGRDLHAAGVLEIVERAAQRIQQAGYFGPLGIDVMQYRTPTGEIRWRPLQDINARWTMGRVALGWRRMLAPDAAASWLHFRWPSDPASADPRLADVLGELPADVRVIRTSPLAVGGRPASVGTALVIGRSDQCLVRDLPARRLVHGEPRD
jgi:hypothetical protein